MTNNINTMEPFSNDKLGRKTIAEHFRNILLNTDLNVFSLVASWGYGKTYFIQNLIRTMEEDSINILYNAWESDFYDSPLIPLLIELISKIETYNIKDKLTEDINWSKKFAEKVCKGTTFQAGINIGVINCSANFDPNVKMIDSEYMKLKAEIKTFRNKLQNIQKNLKKKIIIFIDELDRCHPMYTIKTLEVIKHFFGIEDIVFVLAVDKSQIENSVRTIFGVNQGTENGYLRKFIDVEFELPEPNLVDFISFHIDKIWDKIIYFIEKNRYYNYHLQRIVDSFGIERDMDKTKEKIYISEMITKIANLFQFSLRDIEKYFMRFSLILDELQNKDALLIEPCIVLNALSMINMKYFEDYINSNANSNSKIKNIDTNVIPYWKGFFLNSFKESYKRYRRSERVNRNTDLDNANNLMEFFKFNGLCIIEEQEKYLQEYPLKIKFIHNFNTLN